MSQNNHEEYLYIIQQLKEKGFFSKAVSKTWEKRPKDLNTEAEISWFRHQLIARGYVAEYVLAEIPEQQTFQQNQITHKKFGRFTLLEEIGKGGMGKVYRAFDPYLNKDVALKMLTIRSSDKTTKRFIAEAQIMAQLHHRNIINFYDINHIENQYYLTMEYIRGTTLRGWISYNSLLQKRIDVFQKICWAIHQVHQSGIVHRDLKPENIMIDDDGEPVVMDFGIAKNRDVLFSTVNILGTPNYMSPEQAQGKDTDFCSDIFSLGIMLYELLTERLPFIGESDFDIFNNIVHQDPIPPKLIHPKIPQELETICLKCLEKEKNQRYKNVLELAQDIERFKNNETIMARPASRWTKSIKWLRRNRLVVTIGILALLSVFTVLVLYIVSIQRFSQQSTQMARVANIRLAKIALSRSQEAYHTSEWKQSGVFAGVCLQSLSGLVGEDVVKLQEHAKELVRLNLLQDSLFWQKSANGVLGQNYIVYNNKKFRVCNIETDEEIFSRVNPDSKNRPYLYGSEDGSLLAFHLATEIQIWNVHKATMLFAIPVVSKGYITFSPQNTYISFRKQKMICIWSLKENKLSFEYPLKFDSGGHNTFSRSETKFAYANEKVIFVRNLNSDAVLQLQGHASNVAHIIFTSDQQLISSAWDGIMNAWELNTGRQIFSVRDKGLMLGVSKTGEIFASSIGSKVFVWDSELGRIIHIYDNKTMAIQMTFSDDGERLFCSDLNTVNCWRVFYSKRLFYIDNTNAGGILSINHDSALLSYVSKDSNKVQLWDIASHKKNMEIEHHDIVTDFQFSQHDNSAISACQDGQIYLWQNGELVKLHQLHKEYVSAVRFHPQNRSIIASASSSKIILYNVITQQHQELTEHKTPITTITFSHNGSMLASSGETTFIWDLKTYQVIQRIPYKNISKTQLDFSSDNQRLMSCDFENVYFWDINTAKLLFESRFSHSNSCIFSPYYNNFIVSDYKYRLIDSRYGYPIQDFYAGWNRTRCMVSSREGIFAVCHSGYTIILKLPKLPVYHPTTLPAWHKQFPQSSKSSEHSSCFDVSVDTPGWFIESALTESPQLLTEILFGLRINENLTFQEQ